MLSDAVRGLSVTTSSSRCHSRLTPLAEKSRLPSAFGIFPIGHSLPFLISLLLE